MKDTHSKVKDLLHEKHEIQKYLVDPNIMSDDKHLIFKLRTRMVDVKKTFKSQYLDTKCNFCEEEETQVHLLECNTIIQNCKELYEDMTIEYEDLFKTLDKQLKLALLFKQALKTRDQLLKF